MDDIEIKIRKIINENLGEDLYKDIDEISKSENIFNIGLDSLNIVKLIMAVEEEYEITFEDEEIASINWKNIESIINLVKNKKRGK